jgi:hypothetical protein
MMMTTYEESRDPVVRETLRRRRERQSLLGAEWMHDMYWPLFEKMMADFDLREETAREICGQFISRGIPRGVLRRIHNHAKLNETDPVSLLRQQIKAIDVVTEHSKYPIYDQP